MFQGHQIGDLFISDSGSIWPTLGARGLHTPHPDSWPKAGKMSRQHEVKEVSEVLATSDLWLQLSKTSLSC